MIPLDTLRRAVRARICTTCPRRSRVLKHAGPDVALPCEGECPLFSTLPALMRTATNADPMLSSPRRMMERTLEHARDASKRSSRAGRHPGHPATDRRNEEITMRTIEDLLHLPHD